LILVLAGAVLLVIVALLVHVIVLHLRRHRRLREDWAELARRLTEAGLARAQAEVAMELAQRASAADPLQIIRSSAVFERAVHGYLAGLSPAGAGPGSQRRAAEQITVLRKKLAVPRPEGRLFYSSRQVESGQQVHIAPLDERLPVEVEGRVGRRREDALELVGVEPASPDLEGRRVEVIFFAGKGAFRFETEVLEVDPQSSSCLLAHALEVESAGERQLHRVKVDRPSSHRGAWEEADVEREAILRDLSGGGCALVCGCVYEEGEEVVVSVTPGLYLEAGEVPPDRELTGRVVEARQVGNEQCMYHVEFTDLAEGDRRYLLDLVRRIELAGVGG
jgi:hypothetical protein